MSARREDPNLLQVPLYVAGKSPREAMEAAGVREAVKLSSNENPLGPSPLALQALRESLGEAHRYPGLAERDLVARLVEAHGEGLGPENFLIGNGATDLLRLIAQGFLFDGGECLMGEVSFPLYRMLSLMFGARPMASPPRPDWQLDLKEMATAVSDHTRIIWLCSPNNPTGLTLGESEVRSFLNDLPEEVVVVIDESYVGFVHDRRAVDGVALLRSGLNLIAVRSFSKSAGLANLRVGYAVSTPEVIEYLRHAHLPFNTGGLVLKAAAASLDDHDYRERIRKLIVEEREFLMRSFGELGLDCPPSQSNFVLLPQVPGGGKEFADRLLRQGFIVRPMGAFGLPGGVRVSVGTHDQNLGLVEGIRRALSESLSVEGGGT